MAKRAASKSDKRTIRVFIASPGDLAVERRAFKEVIEELNTGFGDGKDVKFEALGWEDTLASTGRRSQGVINREIDRCDVFILAMHLRWGQEAPDALPFSSYTEEEFHRAYDHWQKKPPRGKPQAPEIFVFFKHVTPREIREADPQVEKVLAFRKSLEDSRQVLYRGFANKKVFKAEVDRHLRAFAKGKLPKADAPRDKVLLPLAAIDEVKKAKAEAEQAVQRAEREHRLAEAAVARAETFALEFAERAAKAALEGRVEEARQDFANATDGTTNLRVLYLAYSFYNRTGDLATAEELLERWLAISGRDAETAETAAALGNLGLIYRKRGELEQAEEMHKKALAIDENLGNQEGMASQYGNLGLVYKTRGELDRAEEMHTRSLDISVKLGRQEGMASQYCNLGVIYVKRGELDRAEKIHRKSLAIWVRLGRAVGKANQYGNLGLIHQTRGQLDRAEAMYQKSLAINEKLGRQRGIASQYDNLASIAKDRGEFERARELWTKARDLYAKIGMPLRVKREQGLLDGLSHGGATE